MGRLVRSLGATATEVFSNRDIDDVDLVGTRIYDTSTTMNAGSGDVLLAVNIDPASASAASVIESAARLGATAVAFKDSPDGLRESVAPLAARHGLALLCLDPDLSWEQLLTLFRNIAASAANAPDGDADDQTPLGDLFALANALAAAAGAAVTIEDPHSTLLAYSNLDHPIDVARRETILGRGTPGQWMSKLVDLDIPHRMLAAPGKVVAIHDDTGETADRLAIAVSAGAEFLGSVWLVEGDKPFDATTMSLLEEAAPLAALHLLRHRAADELSRSERGRALHALLDGSRPPAEVAATLGIDVAARAAMVCFRLVGAAGVDLVVKRARALDLIVLTCEAFRRSVVCAGIGSNVYALFPGLTEAGEGQFDEFLRDLALRASNALGVRVVAGVGSTVSGVSEVTGSRTEADRAARVLEQADSDRAAARLSQVHVRSTLLEIGDVLAARPDLRLPSLDRLARHDREHGKAYVETLRVLARASWDVPAAAAALGLHSNSLRYRMKRIEAIGGLLLDDPQHRLVLSLQLMPPVTGL